jgi:hypothetical protein
VIEPSPNHALQRTAPRVTLAATDRPATFAHPAPATFPQPARRAPQSLSLGSFGVSSMRKLLLIIFLPFVLTTARATPQQPDTVIQGGAVSAVYGFAFDAALKQKLFKLAYEDKRWMRNSSLWRGYRAVLQIRDKRLFLVGMDFNTGDPKPSARDVLGFDIPDSGVPATWFTGKLFYYYGDTWGYSHTRSPGDATKHSRVLHFKEGMLTNVEDLETPIPVELITDHIMEDIEKLSELLKQYQEQPKQP